MNFLEYLIGVPIALLVLYIAVRFASTAYFKSKREYISEQLPNWMRKSKLPTEEEKHI